MLKNILNLEGAAQLSKKEQKTISGGGDGELEIGGRPCWVMCNSGSQYPVPNCDTAPDGICHSTGWSICTCSN